MKRGFRRGHLVFAALAATLLGGCLFKSVNVSARHFMLAVTREDDAAHVQPVRQPLVAPPLRLVHVRLSEMAMFLRGPEVLRAS